MLRTDWPKSARTAGLLQEIQPFKGSVTSPTGPLSLQMPSFCIGLARRQTNAWQKSRKEQVTQRPSRPQKSTKRGTYEKYTPKEKAKTSCYAWYHSHNKASPSLTKLCSDHEIFNTKINNFANFEFFTKFLCLENLELYGMLSWLLKQPLIFFNNLESIYNAPGVFWSTPFLTVLMDQNAENQNVLTPVHYWSSKNRY